MADQDNTQKQGQPAGTPDSGAEPEEKPKSGKKFIVFAVILAIILGAGYWYWRGTFSEETDDAQVDGDIYQISSRIAGQVIHVYVQDNKPVNKGELLLEIDPKDEQVALEQAQAQLASAQASYTQAQADLKAGNLGNYQNDINALEAALQAVQALTGGPVASTTTTTTNPNQAAADALSN